MRLRDRVGAGLTMLMAFVILAFCLVPQRAEAGSQYYSFQGYDLTQATTWNDSLGHCSSPCHVPLVNAVSHFATTMYTSAVMVHYWNPDVTGQQIFNPPLAPAAGQVVGVICWTTSSTWGIVDKIDARFSIGGTTGLNPNIPAGSYLFIGYVKDDWVNLSWSDRVNFVPQC